MNNLYQELVSGKLEVKPDGTPSTRGPTALELRAAKALQTIVGVNENNNLIIQQMQLREASHMEDIIKHRKEIEKLNNQLTKENDERVRNSRQETSEMGSSQLELFGSP